MRWLVGLAVLAVGYFLMQPMLVRKLGVDLPGWRDLVSGTQSSGTQSTETSPQATNGRPKTNGPTTDRPTTEGQGPNARSVDEPASRSIETILSSRSRQTYTSPAGLRYTQGSQQGHRLKHLMAHAEDAPNRPGQHGVFDDPEPAKIVALVDEAYLQAQAGRDTRTQREGERIVYEINLRRRIGYVGGTSGKRKGHPAANYLRLVIDNDRVITAFPVRL